MNDLKKLEDCIRNSLATATNNSSTNGISLGPLQVFASLFPHEFTGTSLQTLATLCARIRLDDGTRNNFSLQVKFGVGLTFQKELYSFFDSMILFQSKKQFEACLSKGYSLHITGGSLHEIVAAVTFIATPDGLFIDAIAVSNGRVPGACKLNVCTFVGSNDAEELFINQAEGGSFQHSGLGNFLLALVGHCAAIKCTVKNASVFLKANDSFVKFYHQRGFTNSPPTTSLPGMLSKLVPAENQDTTPSWLPSTSLLPSLSDFLIRPNNQSIQVTATSPN
jgi:hypothetical protein